MSLLKRITTVAVITALMSSLCACAKPTANEKQNTNLQKKMTGFIHFGGY